MTLKGLIPIPTRIKKVLFVQNPNNPLLMIVLRKRWINVREKITVLRNSIVVIVLNKQ